MLGFSVTRHVGSATPQALAMARRVPSQDPGLDDGAYRLRTPDVLWVNQ